MMKSFRFKMSTGSNDFAPPDRVRLATNQGLIGYKITKLQLIPKDPTDASHEAVVQVFATRPGGNNPGDTDEIDFGNPSLLACAHYSNHSSGTIYSEDSTIIFDSTQVNQDMWVTCKTDSVGKHINVYLELEQTTLSTHEAAVATLKDMRGRA